MGPFLFTVCVDELASGKSTDVGEFADDTMVDGLIRADQKACVCGGGA